jgi:hypothetical protein
MTAMNYWTDKWDLHVDICPCDVHVNEWLAAQKMTNKLIYHFGTGTHHVVGKKQAENKSGNAVFGITASIEEYEAYIKLVAENSDIAKNYIAYFGDIYLTNPKLLPDFDVVTMVHICEFLFPNTASKEYGGLDDRGVLDLFTKKTKPGGHILFYTKSIGWEKAKPVIAAWEKSAPVKRLGDFETLAVYQKAG